MNGTSYRFAIDKYLSRNNAKRLYSLCHFHVRQTYLENIDLTSNTAIHCVV